MFSVTEQQVLFVSSRQIISLDLSRRILRWSIYLPWQQHRAWSMIKSSSVSAFVYLDLPRSTSRKCIIFLQHWRDWDELLEIWECLTSNFFPAMQSYCSCLPVGLLLYYSRLILIRLDRTKKLDGAGLKMIFPSRFLTSRTFLLNIVWFWTELAKYHSSTHPDFFLQPRRIRVDLLLYGSKLTDKRKQYKCRDEKVWTVYWT